MNTAETVERVVAPVLSTLGIELVDVESHPGHLRVTIDRSSGLDLAAISQATTAVSHALDEADAVPGGRYELEVSRARGWSGGCAGRSTSLASSAPRSPCGCARRGRGRRAACRGAAW